MVGLGDTTKKLQKVAGMAEDVYQRMSELRDQMVELRKTVEATHETVRGLDRRVAEQEALVRELAEREGVDVEAVIAEANITEAEAADTDADTDAGGGDGDTPAEPAGEDASTSAS
jgi:uncharacterized protein YukE